MALVSSKIGRGVAEMIVGDDQFGGVHGFRRRAARAQDGRHQVRGHHFAQAGERVHGARRHLAHQGEPRAEIFKVGHGVGEAGQNRGLLRRFQKLIGNLAVPVGQFAAHVLPVLAVALAGFVGGADQHVRNAAHGGNHHHHFGPLGVVGNDLRHVLHPLRVADGGPAEFHGDERLLALTRQLDFLSP